MRQQQLVRKGWFDEKLLYELCWLVMSHDRGLKAKKLNIEEIQQGGAQSQGCRSWNGIVGALEVDHLWI